jgi:hypothetical protein
MGNANDCGFKRVPGQAQVEYLELATELRPPLANMDKFIFIELFSESDNARARSCPCPSDAMRLQLPVAQFASAVLCAGCRTVSCIFRLLFADGAVTRDYGMTFRDEAPTGSRMSHTVIHHRSHLT